jgi:hypothetical protein
LILLPFWAFLIIHITYKKKKEVILEPWVAGSHADEILSSMGFGRFHGVGIIRDHLGY